MIKLHFKTIFAQQIYAHFIRHKQIQSTDVCMKHCEEYLDGDCRSINFKIDPETGNHTCQLQHEVDTSDLYTAPCDTADSEHAYYAQYRNLKRQTGMYM